MRSEPDIIYSTGEQRTITRFLFLPTELPFADPVWDTRGRVCPSTTWKQTRWWEEAAIVQVYDKVDWNYEGWFDVCWKEAYGEEDA